MIQDGMRVLVFSAHAADFCSRAGGAIIRFAEAGGTVHVHDMTYGERCESPALWARDPRPTIEEVKGIRKEEFEAAANWLREVHPSLRTYWTDPAELSQLMATGEVLVNFHLGVFWNCAGYIIFFPSSAADFNVRSGRKCPIRQCWPGDRHLEGDKKCNEQTQQNRKLRAATHFSGLLEGG